MDRRSFLQGVGAATGVMLFPPLATQALAAPSTLLPRYWLQIHCGGGWCPLSSFDPHPEPARNYSAADILTYGAFRSSPFIGSTSTYPDPVTGRADTLNYYDRFFTKYQSRMLVVNGVDNQSGDHPTAALYSLTGGLALPYPNFGALAAAVLEPSLPMSYCGNNTQGIIGGSQANMGALQAASGPLLRMASPNTIDPNSGTTTYQANSTWNEVLAAVNSRVGRMQGLEKVAMRAQQRALLQVARANNDNSALINVLNTLFSNPVNPNDAAATVDVLMGCFQARLAVAGSISLPTGALGAVYNNFDAHAAHDARMYPLMDATMRIIDYAVTSAETAGIALNVVVTSDFSRTPGYNAAAGTDHNPGACSYMFIGPDFIGGRQVGATTVNASGYVGLPVNATTLQEDPNGVSLTAAHIHAALRHVANIDTSALSARFPVNTPVLPLFTG